MANNELPNLSTWHRVPVGATVPAGTPYAYAYQDGITVELGGRFDDLTVSDDRIPRYTEHPIAPPLPTEEGTTIMVSGDERLPPHILVTREAGHWVNHYGLRWYVDQIHAWAPVTVGETVVRP